MDVHDEIIRLYEEADTKGFNVGEALYTQSFFFADHELLIDSNMQNRIKEFQFCKTFSCPPYPSLKETELNKYSTDEIIGIANTIFEIANKKK